MPFSLKATEDDDQRRLDRILRKALRDLPLSAIHRLLRKGRVLIDGKKAAAGDLVVAGQTITVDVDESSVSLSKENRRSPGAQSLKQGGVSAEGLQPAILFEGAGILLLNKASGLVVHGKASLETLVHSYLKHKIKPSLSFRPGPLHRLDKESSGLIAFSTSLEGARLFSSLMRDHCIKKTYLTLVQGRINKDEVWNDELVRDRENKKSFIIFQNPKGPGLSLQQKTALTLVKPLASNSECTLIMAEIKTGRTHQIRSQAAFRGHPLLGDVKYGGKSLPGRSFLLHAWRMEFPKDLPFPSFIEAPLPEYFLEKVKELFGDDKTSRL